MKLNFTLPIRYLSNEQCNEMDELYKDHEETLNVFLKEGVAVGSEIAGGISSCLGFALGATTMVGLFCLKNMLCRKRR